MDKEDRALLLRDLSARLPYNVRIYSADGDFILTGKEYDIIAAKTLESGEIDGYKPYLRPLSSMTEEEKLSLKKETGINFYSGKLSFPEHDDWGQSGPIFHTDWFPVFHWLDSRHFDYRELLGRHLAIEKTI